MRTFFTSKAALAAPPIQKPLLSALLKGMATALIATTIFTIQPTTQAQASWWCWSWFCTPSAADLVNGRPKLQKQTPAVKKYLTKLVEEYRSFGASESEVKIFLDKLEIQFNKLSSNTHFFDNWLISSVHAQVPTDLACVVPPLIPTICIPTQALKLITLATVVIIGNEAGKKLKDLHIQQARTDPTAPSVLVPIPDVTNMDPCSFDPELCGEFGNEIGDHTDQLRVTDGTARKRLVKVMQTPQNQVAHHLIPWQTRTHQVVIRASRAGFNMNGRVNGINVGNNIQHGGHYHYNRIVRRHLDEALRHTPNMTDQQAAAFLFRFTRQLRTAIQNNPTSVLR